MLARTRSTLAPRLRPSLAVASRGLRHTAALRSEVMTPSGEPGAVKTNSTPEAIAAFKYFDGESLVAHQERVRHDNPANRTFNYTLIGAPPPLD